MKRVRRCWRRRPSAAPTSWQAMNELTMQHSSTCKLGLSKVSSERTQDVARVLGEFPVPALSVFRHRLTATYCCEQVLAAVDTLMDNMPFHDDVAVILDQVCCSC